MLPCGAPVARGGFPEISYDATGVFLRRIRRPPIPREPRRLQTGGMEIFLVENSALIAKRLCEMLGALPGVSVLGHASRA